MKTCSKCKIQKDYLSFAIRKSAKDGLKSACKECNNLRERKRYSQNPDFFKQKQKEWKLANPKRAKELSKKAKFKHYHSERGQQKRKQYLEKNRDKHRIYQRIWYHNNKEKAAQHKRKHYLKNKNKIIARRTIYAKYKYQSDPIFRLKHMLRALTRHAFKKQGVDRNARTNTKTARLLGCSWEFAKQHIESLFKEGMTWQNQGEWEIDHIVAISRWDLNSEEDIVKCFNYTNLQPLWAKENRSKGNRLTLPASHG